jgi:plastocyanin
MRMQANTVATARGALLAAAFLMTQAAAAASAAPPTPHAMPMTAVIRAATDKPGTTVADNTVSIMNFAFQPTTLTVAAGSRVVWVNHDDEPHLVVSAGAQFKASPAMDTDDRYALVFATPGTYTYFCSIHPHMVGKIIVK